MSTPKRAIIFDGQNMSTADLEFPEEKRVEEDDLRFKEIGSTYGILAGVDSDLALSNPTPYTGNVAAGVAYDDLGQTIRVVTDDTNPLRAAPLEFTFAGGDVGKLVTLAYATEQTTPKDHPVTGTPGFTRLDYNPTVHLRVTAAAHEVIIGTIETIDGSGNATFNTDDAQYWGARLTPQLLTNISDALGGLYRHQDQDHVSGIEHVGPGSDPGAVTIDGGPNPDEVNVQDTASKDSLLVFNKRISYAAKLTNKNLKFDGPEATVEAQLWAIYVDTEGVCGKLLIAQHDALTLIPGMQIVDFAPFGVWYPDFAVAIEHWKSGSTHHIRIAGNRHVAPTTNGFYYLRLDDNPNVGILIYVTVGSLPSGGSTGSPHIDNITLSDLAGNSFVAESAPVTVHDGSTGGLWLANVWWSGTADEKLGYGSWGTTGLAYDKRNYGNLDWGKLSDSLRTRLDRMTSETRTHGFVAAPILIASSLSLVANIRRADALSTTELDPTAELNAAYAYFDGKRVSVPASASFTLPVTSSRVVYLQDNGNGTSTWGVQAGTGLIGVPLASGRMPVWNLETDGTGIIDVQDLTVVLSGIDREAVRLGRKNVGAVGLGAAFGDAAAALLPRLNFMLPVVATAVRSAIAAARIAIPLTGFEGSGGSDTVFGYLGRGWTVYSTNNADESASFELVFNAYWDSDDDKWHRRDDTQASSILEMRYFGQFRIYRREVGSLDEWDHVFNDPDGWESQIFDVQHSQGIFAAGLAQIAFTSSTALTPVSSKKCSVSRNTGTDVFTVTFNPPMPDDTYVVNCTAFYYSAGDPADGYILGFIEDSRSDSTLLFHLNGIDNIKKDIDLADTILHIRMTVSGG